MIGALGVVSLGVLLYFVAGATSLSRIGELIEREYVNVKQIDIGEFSRLPASDVIVFDVREQEEFSVSHLSNAIQLAPNISAQEFEQRFGDHIADKTAVFYCSVGRRSSKLASELEDVLQDNGAVQFYNLRGGIFNWRNQQQPLVSPEHEATQKVHPYNAFWGRLIKDKSAISY